MNDKLTIPEKREFKKQLNELFTALEKAGYYARQNYWCCNTCAWNDVPTSETKVVFYHNQNMDEIPFGYVRLSWEGNGVEICHLINDCGMVYEWDGDDSIKILVKYYRKAQ